MKKCPNLVNEATIKNLIYVIRGQQVMLDSDLARLYQVETKNLNKAVKRNEERFPEDFCFQLSEEEYNSLRFQIGTSNIGNGKCDKMRSERISYASFLKCPSMCG